MQFQWSEIANSTSPSFSYFLLSPLVSLSLFSRRRYETSLWTQNPTSDYAFIVDKTRYSNLNFSFEICLRSSRDLITARFVVRFRLLLQFNTWNILFPPSLFDNFIRSLFNLANFFNGEGKCWFRMLISDLR